MMHKNRQTLQFLGWSSLLICSIILLGYIAQVEASKFQSQSSSTSSIASAYNRKIMKIKKYLADQSQRKVQNTRAFFDKKKKFFSPNASINKERTTQRYMQSSSNSSINQKYYQYQHQHHQSSQMNMNMNQNKQNFSPAKAKDYRTECVNYHNILRANHNTQGLQYSPKLSAYAQNWADTLARMEDYVMHSGGDYGENIFMSIGGKKKNLSDVIRRAIKLWYNESRCYNYYNAQSSCVTGHFTQVIWRNSKEVGIGVAHGKDGKTWVVAEYYPPGNYHGMEKSNVLPPKRKLDLNV